MSIATVRPNETVALGGASVTGAANAHTATSDDSDSSYLSPAGAFTNLGFAEPTIPGGATLKEVRVRTRSARSGSSFAYKVSAIVAAIEEAQQQVAWITPTTTTLAIFGANAFNLADVELRVELVNGSGRLHEVFLDFVYIVGPVVTVTAPTGTVTDTNLPRVTWEVEGLDPDAGPQTHFEVKVFDAATFAEPGFDPDTSTPIVSSGIVRSHETFWQIPGLDADDNPLPNGDYHAAVRIAQSP